VIDSSNSQTLIWRAAGGGGTRQGLFARTGDPALRVRHLLPALGAVQAAVVFDAEDRAFVADMAAHVHAFSLDGAPLWQAAVPGAVSATPVLHATENRIFIGTHAGWACALDSATGASLWQKPLPTKADPRILSDLLYVPEADAVVLSSWGGRFHALEASTGNERFSWDAGLAPYAAASTGSGGFIYSLRAVANRGVEFVRVSSGGEERVLHDVPEEKRGARRTLVAAAPVVDVERGRIYFVSNRDQGSWLHAWSEQEDRLLWQQPLPKAVQATPAVRADGVILLADLAGFVQALGPDGTNRFQHSCNCDYLLAGMVSDADGTSFLGDPLGFVHVLDRLGAGKAVFEAKRSIQARPSFDRRGSLYVPSTDRHVYVFAAV
jgi:outer membrane protein assembly factor BamB